MKLVYIEWLDSHGATSRWGFVSELEPEPLVCRSVGWLAHDGEECKAVVPHITPPDHKDADQQCVGVMTIPTVAIKKMVVLKDPSPKPKE